MITEDQLSLMTAAIDSQLSERQREALRQLLAGSAEAREVLDRLKFDSDRLRALPRVPAPAELHRRVMAKLASLTPPYIASPAHRAEASRHPILVSRRRHKTWLPIAVAVALLIGVTGSSFWYFSRDTNSPVARNAERPPLATKRGADDPAWVNWLPTGRSPASAPMPSEKQNNNIPNAPEPKTPAVPSHDVAIAPLPKPILSDGLGFPPLPETRFDTVQVRLPFLRPLAEFENEDIRHQLVEELGRDPAFRVDLFSRNLTRAIDTFKQAARSEGLSLHIDSNAMSLAKKGQVSAVAIYTDSLSAVELADLFAKLSAEDARVTPRAFDVLHASPIARSDEVELRTVLGADPGLFKRTMPERRERTPQGGKSISDETADHIVKSITAGKGKVGILLAWSPAQVRALPASSAELKSYHSRRSERKPGAVPVVIVIRIGNG